MAHPQCAIELYLSMFVTAQPRWAVESMRVGEMWPDRSDGRPREREREAVSQVESGAVYSLGWDSVIVLYSSRAVGTVWSWAVV
jgi:hypothetical protein